LSFASGVLSFSEGNSQLSLPDGEFSSRLDCYLEGYHYALAHLEIRSVHPERAALPMTKTGYRSHFEVPENVDAVGGPDAFVRAWLAEAARSPEWRTRQAEKNQLSLFS
jgi:hypothetical protein